MGSVENLPDLTIVAIPLYIVTMAVEIFLHVRRPVPGQRGYATKDTATSLAMGLGSLVVAAALAALQLLILSFFAQFAIVDLGALDSSTWVLQTGQSGHAGHSHYIDQLDTWNSGGSFAWPFSSAAVEAATTDRLALLPKP